MAEADRREAMVRAAEPHLRRLAHSVAKNPADIEDAYHAARITAWKLASEYLDDPDRFEREVFGRARGPVLTELRKDLRYQREVLAIQRAAMSVHLALEMGNKLEESLDRRKNRLTNAGDALAAAVMLGFLRAGTTPEEDVAERELRELRRRQLGVALERMSPQEREVIVACELADPPVTVAEVARPTGVNENTLRSRLNAAKTELGRQMKIVMAHEARSRG